MTHCEILPHTSFVSQQGNFVGCMLPKNHAGPHVGRLQNNTYFTYQDNFECDCGCWEPNTPDDVCKIYRQISHVEAIALANPSHRSINAPTNERSVATDPPSEEEKSAAKTFSKIYHPTCLEYSETYSREGLYEIMAGVIATYIEPWGDVTKERLLDLDLIPPVAYYSVANMVFQHTFKTGMDIPKSVYNKTIVEILRENNALK